MRFIFNFIFFGILFYLIWLYFPDAFKTLVEWASNTFDFFKHLVQTAVEKVNETKVPPAPPSPPAPSSLLIPFFSNWKS
ncbi:MULTISPECIES: hypothetical protein [Parachlamydia]|uniref:Uncharacterized protein n=2 Tax=Parachlamydia acanthamoebae TaxID=83552 RepID=F8L2L9_PARAV|nr:hypothetical protein [Parachlamydia acanthamoebae]EFB42826.1 hypothetical protein pah_c001o008 [Parachlamydia acanthamoebae str. Hall's coccus]KIA76737.1 hypothetical protein DB43_HK00100 [Parachlamydia acanthamoebae]CCB87545.1 putative uncharacterized protein [Parachlamydia acanthamoebae UV-7]